MMVKNFFILGGLDVRKGCRRWGVKRTYPLLFQPKRVESQLSGRLQYYKPLHLRFLSKSHSMYLAFRFTRRMGFWCCTCLLTVLFHFPVALADTHPKDAAALIALGDSWNNRPPCWTGSDPCGSQWAGINCSNSRVISIMLSSFGLDGRLSGDIGSLTELQTLDLSYNKELTGNLPRSIGNLGNLMHLILAGCRFSGQIPDLGTLQKLVTLSLNSNQFTGGIPPSIGRLSNLYVLDITDNMLTGTIPVSNGDSPGLDMLTSCFHFHCGKNQLSGPVPEKLFRSDMKLIHVLFDNNNLSGKFPSTIGLVKSLEVVRLDRNSIAGAVPTNINNLTSVQELHLSNNRLNGPLPNLTGMNYLSYVDLSNNTFDPSDAPPWFSTLTSLTTLVMENLKIRNSLPQALFALPQLQTVRLRNNDVNGTVDLGTNYSERLRLVDLQNNKLDDFSGGEEYKKQFILAGNPFCVKRGPSDKHCTIQQQPTYSYSTPISNCQQVDCSSDQELSPNCGCAYPYVGTLNFKSPSFSDPEDYSIYEDLEKHMLTFFKSIDLPVDSVALHNVTTTSENYLQIGLQIFPSGATCFNQSFFSGIGSILGRQTFLAPKNLGSYYFNGQVYACVQESTPASKSKNLPVIVGATVGGFTLAIIIIALVAYAVRWKRKAERVVEQSRPFASWERTKGSGDAPQLKGPKWFSFDELKRSTSNFSEANEVYKGMLVTGQLVAIKRAQQGSMQGGREFKTEIELLSRVHHKNLVALVGFCFDRGEQMLVYEYIPNGTLRDGLSGKSGIHLDWRRRLQIALGAARGLTYLHELADPPIIHRDVKTSNVLLDDCLNAKLADFGLCKPMSDGLKDHITTQVKGTMGYLDPEYYMTQQLTEKSDVYSFGVLLLELITAKKPIEKGKYIVREVKALMDRAKDHYGLRELVDPSIRLGRPLSGFQKFVDLAMKCVEESGMDRPAMGQVVKEIEGIMLSAGMVPNAESAQTSASYEDASRKHHVDPFNEETLGYSVVVPSSGEPK